MEEVRKNTNLCGLCHPGLPPSVLCSSNNSNVLVLLQTTLLEYWSENCERAQCLRLRAQPRAVSLHGTIHSRYNFRSFRMLFSLSFYSSGISSLNSMYLHYPFASRAHRGQTRIYSFLWLRRLFQQTFLLLGWPCLSGIFPKHSVWGSCALFPLSTLMLWSPTQGTDFQGPCNAGTDAQWGWRLVIHQHNIHHDYISLADYYPTRSSNRPRLIVTSIREHSSSSQSTAIGKRATPFSQVTTPMRVMRALEHIIHSHKGWTRHIPLSYQVPCQLHYGVCIGSCSSWIGLCPSWKCVVEWFLQIFLISCRLW